MYKQHANYVVSLNIDYGGVGYTSPPTITIEAGGITTATATCTVSGGAINTITINIGTKLYMGNVNIGTSFYLGYMAFHKL